MLKLSTTAAHSPDGVASTGRRYLEGITESHRRQSCRLPMKPDLGTKPIVAETGVCTCRISLRKKGGCVPTQLNVAKQSEFQQAAAGSLANAFLRPLAVQAILQLHNAILRDMCRIGDRRSVRICGNGICVATCLLSHPLRNSRKRRSSTHQQGKRTKDDASKPSFAHMQNPKTSCSRGQVSKKVMELQTATACKC
jgi:hypothetical protein